MAKETVGFVRLIWTCPNCGSKNPGPYKFCSGCGAAQPADVKFEEAAQEELVKDAKEIEAAKAGADIHCGFCGARNPAGAKTCAACGADLTEAGVARASGEMLGALHTEPVPQVTCPACGTLNPATELRCAKCGYALNAPPPAAPAAQPAAPAKGGWCLVVGLALTALVIIFVLFSLFRTKDTVGTVRATQWQRRIAIEALTDVKREDFRKDIPNGAVIGTCTQKLYTVQDSPAENSKKVCGTPYKVDKGNGYAEVVQDCQYEVYADYCDYTVKDWGEVNVLVARGSDDLPAWPDISLQSGQREGQRDEQYQVVFDVDGQNYTYTTSDPDLFTQVSVGSRWTLTINGLGSVVSIEPAN